MDQSFFVPNFFLPKFCGHGLFLDQNFVGPSFFFTKTATPITTTTTTTVMGFGTIEINLVRDKKVNMDWQIKKQDLDIENKD